MVRSTPHYRGQSLLDVVGGVEIDASASSRLHGGSKNLGLRNGDRLPGTLSLPIEASEILRMSDDEELEDISRLPDSSDDEEVCGTDIPNTIFKSSITSSHISTRKPRVLGSKLARGNQLSEITSPSQAESPSTSRPRRKANENNNSTPKKAKVERMPQSYSDDGPLFGHIQSQTKKKPLKTTYGSGNSRRRGTSRVGSQSNGDSSPVAIFKKPPEFDMEILDSPRRFLKIRNVDDLDLDGSPTKMPQFKSVPDLSFLTDSETGGPLSQESGTEKGSELPEPPLPKSVTSTTNEVDSPSQVPIFRMPRNFDDSYDSDQTVSNDANEISSESGALVESTSSNICDTPSEMVRQVTCPMCKEHVDAEHLRTFSKGKQMNIRAQAAFCHAHKRKSASNEWVLQGYPTIDWERLDERIAEHHSFLKRLVHGASSYSRDILEESIKSGKQRTLIQAMKSSDLSLTPGYYGTRGLRAMTENIMDKFSPQLRKAAIQDRLVSARGVTGYVQTVLVPELAVRLIGEDMGIGAAEARAVLKASVQLGDLVHEEIEDVVVFADRDDE